MSERSKALRASVRESALVKNPILFEVIGLAPVVAMAVSLKSAIILAVVSCAELMIIELFACLALKKVKSYLRMPIYAALGMLVNIPIFMFFEHFTPNETQNVGIFLPLLAVNSLIALHCERFAVKNTFGKTVVDAVSASIGYAFVVLVIGVLRELLGSGTLYSVNLHFPIQLKGFLMPFGGLVLLGFFAAGVKALLLRRHPEADLEQAFSMQEISQSHIGSIKSLLDADFNPYDEAPVTEDEPRTRTPRPKKHADKKRRTKKPKKATSKKTTPAQTESPAKAPVRPPRAAQENYLEDFNEILSELDAFKEKQSDPAEKSDVVEAPGETETPDVTAQVDVPDEQQEGGDAQ